MISWQSFATSAGTFIGGGAGVEAIRWLRGRGSDQAQTDVNHAAAYNQLTQSVTNLATALADLQRRFDVAEGELNQSRTNQSRLERLLNQAIVALRDFMETARQHDIPVPAMGEELTAEIAGAA